MLRTSHWAYGWTIIRLAIALLIAAAVVTQLVVSVTGAVARGWNVAVIVTNFFSYFTILSNVLAVVALVWAVVWFMLRGEAAAVEPPSVSVALACASTYMIITGIVYNTLLRNLDVTSGTEAIPWTNNMMHVVGPILLLADVFVAGKRRALSFRAVWIVIAVPIAWTVYTMIRGPLTTNPATGVAYWYPYPFLNPHVQSEGYVGVLGWIAVISAVFIAVGFFVVWMSRVRAAVRPDAEAATAA
jgi:hypothetical protein